MKKTMMIMLLLCAALFLIACGAGKATGSSAAQNSGQPEDGQNPVMNFIGVYESEDISILVEAKGNEDAKLTVTRETGENEKNEWIMSGNLDTETLRVEYHDCVKTDLLFGEDGTVVSEAEVYFNGHGFFFFDYENNSLTWQDDQEHIADGLTFVYSAP